MGCDVIELAKVIADGAMGIVIAGVIGFIFYMLVRE